MTRAGQLIARGKRRWLVRVFLGRGATGHRRNATRPGLHESVALAVALSFGPRAEEA